MSRLIDANTLSIAVMDAFSIGDVDEDVIWGLIQDAPTIEQPTWISCDERLPERDVDVLCRSNQCGNCIFIGYIGHKSGAWIDNGVMHIGDVTHWMPLPNPPKGDE